MLLIPSPLLAALLSLQAPIPPETPPDTSPAPPAGVVPAATAPEARALWEAMLAAAFPAGQAERLTSFDLDCWGTVYTGANQTNDFEARIRFLEPGYVRRTMSKTGREQMRGPAGDFMLTAKDGRAVRLEGRDFREDKKELDRTVAVARTFIALTDPQHLTLASLDLQPSPPMSLPAPFAARASELTWLALRSPDFYLAPPAGTAAPAERPLYRVQLGLDRKTNLPELVVVQRDDPGHVQAAQLVQLKKFRTLDGHSVPFEVRTYDPDLSTSPWKFGARPASLLGVNRGSLKPGLTGADFQP